MVQINFDARGVKPNAALQPVPSGEYDVIVTNTQERPTSKNDGSYIEFEFTIQGGEYANQKLYDRLNVNNKSQKAVEIAYGTLSAICHCTGMYQIQDTQQLCGIPLKAVVSKQPRGDTPPNTPPESVQWTNEIKGYKDRYGNEPGKEGSGGGQPAGGGAPWQQGQGQQGQQGGQAAPAGPTGQPQNQQGQAPQQNGGGQQPWQQNGGGQTQPQPTQTGNQDAQGGQASQQQAPPWNQNGGGQNGGGAQQPAPQQGQNGGQPQGQTFSPGPTPPWQQNGGQPAGQ